VEGPKQEQQYLYLTTRGRKSGKPREIEIWFTQHNRNYYVIAEFPTSQWAQNLQANPQVEVRVGSKNFRAMARVISGESEPEVHRTVQELSRQKYGWGDGLIVQLTPDSNQQLNR